MEQAQLGSSLPRAAAAVAEGPAGIELRHLRYFVALADAGSFTHAAERMFVAQPTLSQQIRRLEEIVGTPLLQRRREGLRLTKAGTVLLDASRNVLPMALAFAATGDRPTAVLTGPSVIAGIRPELIGQPRSTGLPDMVRVSIENHPLTATASLVWSGDLPRALQQILFETADSVTSPARDAGLVPGERVASGQALLVRTGEPT